MARHGGRHAFLHHFFAAGNQNLAKQEYQGHFAVDVFNCNRQRSAMVGVWHLAQKHPHHLYQQHGAADEFGNAVFQVDTL